MYGGKRKKLLAIIIAITLNVLLISCVVLSVIYAVDNASKISFSQNIENLRTLTDASANKVELELDYLKKEMQSSTEYINYYNHTGMTLAEVKEFFASYHKSDWEQDCFWQLVDSVQNDEIGTKKGYKTISLGSGTDNVFVYHIQSYPELAKIFCMANKDTLGNIQFTKEFTDSSPELAKSFAVTSTIRVLDEDTGEYEYKTLMLLTKSEYMNELISNNNDTDTFRFYDYSNIIVDNMGDYVISNNYFQGVNFLDYISLYNNNFSKDIENSILDNLNTENYSDILFYQNNRSLDCAYTIVPVQNSEWHILSVAPLASFHNAYKFNNNFILFAIFFVLLFAVDIVIVMMINRQLRFQTKEAQEASIAKSQFLSSMSHDIRTPMNAIIGMTLIADQELKQQKPNAEALKDCIKTIQLSGNNLLTLINDILDISKIENGKIAIIEDDFSITESVTKMFEIVQSQIKDKHLILKTDITNVQHRYIHADELRVNQIYMNILSNAIKYTNLNGTITITLSEEVIPNVKNRARFCYRVADTGIGMSQEFVNTIFERFSRAVDTRVNTTQGTGLGMAISKQLVDIMGGTITVESELNVGSTFTVSIDFPLAEQKEEVREKEQSISGKPSFDLRVLVAEDNEINWKILDKILSWYDIHADRARDGQEALDMVKDKEESYDIILMDVQMPIMNGYEATKAIRYLDNSSKASVPIYAMTADAFAEDVAKCMNMGMNGHLAKPIENDKLLKILSFIENHK